VSAACCRPGCTLEQGKGGKKKKKEKRRKRGGGRRPKGRNRGQTLAAHSRVTGADIWSGPRKGKKKKKGRGKKGEEGRGSKKTAGHGRPRTPARNCRWADAKKKKKGKGKGKRGRRETEQIFARPVREIF